MHELSLYDTRTVESSEFEPWMIGRTVEIKIVYNNTGHTAVTYYGVPEWLAKNDETWFLKFQSRDVRESPIVSGGARRHLEIKVMLPANYVHVESDGSLVGDVDV